MAIKTQTYGNTKNILLDPNGAYVIEVQVTNPSGLKAGAVLGGATSALQERTAILAVVSDNTAQGILLNDLEAGDTNGVMVVRGVIDSSKIENFATNVPTASQNAMKHIIFRNGEYN